MCRTHQEYGTNDYGWPTHIRTDGGPQFWSEFKEFCTAHGITHELSSPYNPESNGLAEAAVKSLKRLSYAAQREAKISTRP